MAFGLALECRSICALCSGFHLWAWLFAPLLTEHRLDELFVGAASPSKAGIIRGNRYAKLHIYILIHTLEGRRAFVGLTMSWIERYVGNRRSRLA